MEDEGEKSLEVRLGGFKASIKARAKSALGRVIGSAANLTAAKLDAWANEIRNADRMDSAIYDAAVKTIGDDEEQLSRLIGEISAGHIRKLANKKHVVERAIEHISDPQPDGEPRTEEGEVSPDWLDFFGDYAEKANTEAVRDLWGRVLAGEIRLPGTFSLYTLRILAELDQQVARWFDEEAQFRWGKHIVRPPEDMKTLGGDRLQRLNRLEEAGLLNHINPLGGEYWDITVDAGKPRHLLDGNYCVQLESSDRKVVKLFLIPFTRAGREIATILPPVNRIAVLRRIGNAVATNVDSVSIHNMRHLSGNRTLAINPPLEVIK